MMLEMEKKPIARAMQRKLTQNRVIWFYGIATLMSFTVFVVFWCTSIFREAILSNLELRNGSRNFAWWKNPPVNVYYKVYVFNYTNVPEFESGAASKLRVQELGPYIYVETLSRVNVVINENRTVTYQEKRDFKWVGGRYDDELVVVPNVPVLSTVAYSRNFMFVAQFGLTALLSSLQAKPFVNLRAGEFLWGYDDNTFQMAKSFVALKQASTVDKFGILAFVNGVNPDRITMHTGVDDLHKLGMIQRINGMDVRKIWGNEACDRVYGTDGSIFPPYWIDNPNRTLYVYGKDICRQIPFRYAGREFAHGIPTLRYEIPNDVFTSTPTKDSCYCSRESGFGSQMTCPPAGVFNLSACNFGSPLLISFPHFYLADESVREHVDGLRPESQKHRSYLNLHPRLGVTVGGWSRLQMNVEVRKAIGVPFSGKLKDGTILPLIWIDSGVDRIPEEVQVIMHRAHYSANAIEAGFQWCSLIGLVLSFGALITALRRDTRKEPTIPVELNTDTSGQNKILAS